MFDYDIEETDVSEIECEDCGLPNHSCTCYLPRCPICDELEEDCECSPQG